MTLYSSIYAGFLALLFIGLSIRVIRLRRKYRVPVGHGDNPTLRRAIRVQGNFAEYVPLSLVLLFMLEYQTTTPWGINILGESLLIGRLSHAYGVSDVDETYRFRVFGMTLTFFVIGASALWLLFISGVGLFYG